MWPVRLRLCFALDTLEPSYSAWPNSRARPWCLCIAKTVRVYEPALLLILRIWHHRSLQEGLALMYLYIESRRTLRPPEISLIYALMTGKFLPSVP